MPTSPTLGDMAQNKILQLEMFPGITGAGIRIGHGRMFQFADIKALKRQQGQQRYIIQIAGIGSVYWRRTTHHIGKTPRVGARRGQCIIAQLKRLGFSHDYQREISNADPEYYKGRTVDFGRSLYKYHRFAK